ncbi:MAG: AI-2E family transporter [Myxococcales bacterium]|nr:AI-2E family transporter [Myxococcales bacterium]
MSPRVRESVIPNSGPGSRKRRAWFLGVSSVLMLVALIAFRGVLLPFMLAVIVAYVLSPLVEFGEKLRFGSWSPPRWAVVLTIYVALIGLLSGLLALSIPRLAAEFSRLTREAPRAVAVVRNEWLPHFEQRLRQATDFYLQQEGLDADEPASSESQVAAGAAGGSSGGVEQAALEDLSATGDKAPPDTVGIQVRPRANGGFDVLLPAEGLRVVPLGDRGFSIEATPRPTEQKADFTATITEAIARATKSTERTALAVLQTAQTLIGALTRGIFGFVMMLMISAYLLITSDRIFGFLRSLWPPGRREGFDELVRRMDGGLAGVVRGQLIICGVNGILSGIGFYILGLKYWTFLTLLAAVMSIIPIFGSILSTVPAVLVALPSGPGLALLVLAWIVIIHQIEANLLNPKIMGDAARVHPVLVVFALLAGEHVAGIVGALLAVPVLSITQTLFLYLRELALGVPRATSVPPLAPRRPVQHGDGEAIPDPAK